MKQLKFLVMLCITGASLSCTNSSKQASSQNEDGIETSSATEDNQAEDKYEFFTQDELTGVKDRLGNTIIPAEYETVYTVQNLLVAEKDDESFFFDGAKPVFSTGATEVAIDDKYLMAYHYPTGNTMLYFFKNRLALEKIKVASDAQNTFMICMPDSSYAFYSDEGELKAKGLQDIFCLKKVNLSNKITETRYAFKQPDQSYLIYKENGEFLYKLDLKLWQMIGMNYFERDLDEYREYKWTFYYKIDMDQFVYDYTKRGRILPRYPDVN